MGLKDTLKLPQLQPMRVVVELQDGTTRELRPHKDSRKRWTPIVDPMEQLDWARAELFGKDDVTLAVIPNPEVQAIDVPTGAAGPAGERCPGCGRPVGVDDLERMMGAQQVALTWQDKSVQTTLTASAQVLTQLGEVVGTILEVQRLQLQQHRPAAAAANDEDDIVKLLPGIAAKLLGAGDANGLTPERIEKLGAMLDAMPTPERKPAKHATPANGAAASKPVAAPANGANGAAH